MEECHSPEPESRQEEGGAGGQNEAAATTESLSDLKGSFEQQQAMIGQLREALKSKSSSREQEKGAEDYATRLAKMKPRLIRGRGKGRRDREHSAKAAGSAAEEPSTSQQSPPPESPASRVGDGAEEQPVSQEGEASTDIAVKAPEVSSLEPQVASQDPSTPILAQAAQPPSSSQGESNSRAKLLLLRKQREENRIKFERQLRENAEKKATMDEMKDRIERLRLEVEERDQLIESFKVNSPSDPSMQHLYQQILYKDNTIMDLTEKLNNLETIIQDQKEQISEKEQIIAARTEAVSLVTKDRDEKLFKTLQEMDELRQSLREFQEKSLASLNEWKEQEMSLNSIIEGRNKRISVIEENTHRMENVRFELSTHNAELQEKIVLLQSEGELIRGQLSQAREQLLLQTEEIAELKKKIVRAESFGQKKLKALEKQLRSLDKETTLEQSLVEVQNQIAELEEEKGNLQLKLVDFDDIKAKNIKLSEENSSIEKKLDTFAQESSNYLSTISALEKEKVKLIDALNAKDLGIVTLEENNSILQREVEALTQTKVTLELRLCAVEEERDVALSHESSIEKETPLVCESSADVLQIENKSLRTDADSLKTQLEELHSKYEDVISKLKENEDRFNSKTCEYDEKVDENAFLINLLAEKESTITTQSINLEKNDVVVQKLKEEISARDEKLEKQSQTLIALQQECVEVSMKLEESDAIMATWEEKVGNLQKELHSQRETILKLQAHEEKTTKVIREKNILVQNLEGEICSLKESLEQKENSVLTQIDKLEKLDNLLVAREDELADLRIKFEEADSKGEHFGIKNKKLEEDLHNVQVTLKSTISNLEMELEAASCLIQDKENKIETLLGDLKMKEEGINNNQVMISKFESDLCEKNKLYDILLDERAKEEVEKLSLHSQVVTLESELQNTRKDLEDLQLILKERELSLSEVREELSQQAEKNQNLEENERVLERHSNSLTQQNEELQKSVHENEEAIKLLQDELSSILSSQKDESSNLASALVEKEMEIQQLQTSILSASHDASAKSDLVEKWQSELLEKCQKLSDLEEKIISKEQEITDLTQNMQSINQTLLDHQSQHSRVKEEFESEILRLTQNLQQLQEREKEMQITMANNENVKQELVQEVQSFRQQLEEKAKLTCALEEQVRGNEEHSHLQSAEESLLRMTVQELQDKLSTSTLHLNDLQRANQDLEALLVEDKAKIESFNEQLENAKAQLTSKVEENESIKALLSDSQSNTKHLEEKLLSLTTSEDSNPLQEQTDFVALRDHLQETQMKLNETNNKLLEVTTELETLKAKDPLILTATDQESTPSLLTSVSTIPESGVLSSQLSQLQSDLSDSEEEKKLLKHQLEEAQQAIIQLETSLATQSLPKESKDEWDEWGDVDLGQPAVSESSLSVQSSLIEKDRALTVIQEQLKETLEEVNAVTDERKLLEHQMKTLEAELLHKDQRIQSYQDQVSALETEKQTMTLSMQHFDSQKLVLEEAQIKISNYESAIMEYQAKIAELQSTNEAHNVNARESISSMTQTSSDKRDEDSSQASASDGKLEAKDSNSFRNVSSVDVQTDTGLPSNLEGFQTTANLDVTQESAGEGNDTRLQDLQYKVSWYEDQWATWTEHYNQLQASYQASEQQIAALNQHIEALNTSREEEAGKQESEQIQKASKLLDLENEINRLRHLETENSQMQGQIQTLEHQCVATEKAIGELQAECTRLQGIEVLYGELQTSMIEAETKREGSKSRVQELELMVQSAESEISRLRLDLQTLTSAGKSLETERSSMTEEISNLKEEIRKTNNERERITQENTTLQMQVGSLHSQFVEHQEISGRVNSEVNQLRSELEVMEGENERMRTNYEILDGETNRMRTELEILSQNNHLVNAQKESLETEVQRLNERILSLVSEGEHLRGEMQRLVEVSTSAESEILRLKGELNNMHAFENRYQELENRYTELQHKLVQLEEEASSRNIQTESHHGLMVEEVDWGQEGKMDSEHLQGSSSAAMALQEEISSLKEKVIALEKDRNQLADELQTSKIKNGKMIHKLKAANNKYESLKKEFEKTKLKAGGFSDLDQALEEEWKSQVTKAESERDELKVKLDELETEKCELVKKVDILETAQEKYFELKESQDASLIKLSDRNRELEGLVSSLEWKISEYEEKNLDSLPHTMPAVSDDGEVLRLNHKITELQGIISNLTSENEQIKQLSAELESRVESLIKDNENFQEILEKMREAKNKAESDANMYKTSYMELHNDHEILKEKVTKLNENLSQIGMDHATLKAAYDSLYQDYNDIAIDKETAKYDLGIITGEKDKLQEEVDSLKNRLEVLLEEEEEEIIRSLQEECANQRELNGELKDEITQLTEDIKLAHEETERTKHSLDQQVDIQDLLRTELVNKSHETDYLNTSIETQERQLKYLKAELAALKSQSSQQQSGLEESDAELKKMEGKLKHTMEQNQQLTQQIRVMESSLESQLPSLARRGLSPSKEGEPVLPPSEEGQSTELNAALSSLHLRELRCQQLALEINKLLEERDALQLKLSASLRQNQELSRELTLSQQMPPPSSPPSLNQKLEELRELNLSVERKAIDKLALSAGSFQALPPTVPTFTSHTAPPTPTATRQAADYTVMRENQGASSTLFNWILGKSTPKAVLHI